MEKFPIIMSLNFLIQNRMAFSALASNVINFAKIIHFVIASLHLSEIQDVLMAWFYSFAFDTHKTGWCFVEDVACT